MKSILKLMLTVLLLGLSAASNCEEPNSISNNPTGHRRNDNRQGPSGVPGTPGASEHFGKKPGPASEKPKVCEKPTQRPIDPKDAQGVIFDEQTCTYYVLPPKHGFVNIEEASRLAHNQSSCTLMKSLRSNNDDIRKLMQSKQSQNEPDLLKGLGKELLDNEKLYEQTDRTINSTIKLLFYPISSRLNQEYRKLNPESQFDFEPLPISNITFETRPEEIAAGLTGYASRLGEDYTNYLPSWSVLIYLKYPLACEEDWKKDFSLVAHFDYSLGQKSGSVKVHYVIRR